MVFARHWDEWPMASANPYPSGLATPQQLRLLADGYRRAAHHLLGGAWDGNGSPALVGFVWALH